MMISIENDTPAVLDAFDDVSPIKSSQPQGVKELRKGTRYKASWRVAAIVEGQDLHEGKIKDISIHGAAILVGCNLNHRTSVTLHIYIPPLAGHGAPRIMIVHGITSHAIHDAYDQCFRVGIAFVKFELASACAYLDARLTKHHLEAW
ncbi:PilZ domain-containing protein [Candidatus Nitrotoga sp. 1052]|uniref:PilZ domain-containing protein n=1 Tax=Candidatus Nitrotoga sp. 1052 TaxID=2886964 RepID=UPI001EF5B269|nr:PilZ domain-containing protein [Candidatus Nitrotoga sp. 1052]CAH1083903.1 PilZ domain-containing protein [Candidatus Nitrotoga sp. 1052]